MTSTTEHQYAVYYTTVTGDDAAGYVWNRVVWDGTTGWTPPTGSAVVQDDDNTYPIGSTYTASAS